MKIYIELNSLEEGSEALEALRMYKEAGMGGALFERKEEPKEEAHAPAAEPKKEEEPAQDQEPAPTYPSLAEVREAVKALQEAVGKEDTKKLLAEYGAKGASSVKEEDREAFLQQAEAVING